MNGIQDLLLNFLLILLPIFLYQTFWIERLDIVVVRNRAAITLLTTASVLLCMTFPVYIAPGYVYDLRLIVLLLGILYGGAQAGVFTLIAMFAYRYYLGGVGYWVMLEVYPVFVALAFLLLGRFRRSKRFGRVTIAMLLTGISSTAVNTVVLLQHPEQAPGGPTLPFYGVFTLLHVLGAWLCVYLIENMREKLRLRQEMQRAEKLRVLGELAASLAHEIRNPMTVVRGFLQLLQRDGVPEHKQLDYLQISIAELDRSEAIITRYLAFARPRPDRPDQEATENVRRLNVGEHVRDIAAILSSYALLRGVEIDYAVEDELVLETDPEKLTQVLVNLAKNGIEAMPDGGLLQIRASRRDARVVIDIRDSGVGMTQEETDRLGDAFYTTKEQGTGLGLMVCYQIVHSMNGTIEVTSEKGQGTQFAINLPAY